MIFVVGHTFLMRENNAMKFTVHFESPAEFPLLFLVYFFGWRSREIVTYMFIFKYIVKFTITV